MFIFVFIETDPCKADPCHNGRCIPISDGSYHCDCVEGFSGPNCNGEFNGELVGKSH